MTSLTARAVEAMEGVSTRDAGRAKNLFALGVVSWLYDRPTEPTEDWLRRKFVNKPGPLEANLAAFRAGWNFGETSELIDVQYRVDPATDVPPGTYRNVNGTPATALGLIAASVRVGPAAGARQLPDHARVRAAARARAPPGHGRADDPGRGRDRRRRHGARRRVRRRARRDRDERPGHGPEGRDDRPRDDARAADGRDRRPARRAVDRHADQDRAVGPADGDPRPPRRVAAAGRRRRDAGPVLRRRLRGGADRGPLPHAGDPAVRPVPGQLERAVADPGRRCAAADRPRVRAGAGRRRAVPAVRARRARRAAVGDPRHARPRAPHRRAREAGRHRRHLLRRRQPRADDARSAPTRIGGIAADLAPLEVDEDAGAELLVLGWGSSLRRDPRRRPPRAR